MARLVPVEEKPKVDLQEVLAQTRAFRKERPLRISPEEIKEWINEGRECE